MNAGMTETSLYVSGAQKYWHIGEGNSRIIYVGVEKHLGFAEGNGCFVLCRRYLIDYDISGEPGSSAVIT